MSNNAMTVNHRDAKSSLRKQKNRAWATTHGNNKYFRDHNRRSIATSSSRKGMPASSRTGTLAKPRHISNAKRAVSLPADLRNTTALATKDLFWFLPKRKHRQTHCSESDDPYQAPRSQQRHRRHCSESHYPCKATDAAVVVTDTRLVECGRTELHRSHFRAFDEFNGMTAHCREKTSSSGNKFRLSPLKNLNWSGDYFVDTADEHDFPLLGLEIMESVTENEIEKENQTKFIRHQIPK
ncbi:unnamed protein product [Pseudo-nitzschia multistriata]|uniref:Uncharacterized protein n=1 Tax=Pseudo-nitzschia multistriata TaxID=183589 RepID=A0A448ZBE1_9STRA|nr:unnamed protein product [Pseudo-nitzschia multistriata]